MSHENAADPSAALQASRTKSKCIELLALAADYREVLPQVLELLRQYYAAEQVQFCECGDADAGKPDSIGRLAESEKTNVGGAGNFAASVIFEEKLYGNAEIGAVRIKQLVLSVRIFFDFGRENGAVGPRGIGNFIGGVKPAVLCKGDVVSELFVVCFGVYGVDGGVFVPVGIKAGVTSRAARGKKNRAERRRS